MIGLKMDEKSPEKITLQGNAIQAPLAINHRVASSINDHRNQDKVPFCMNEKERKKLPLVEREKAVEDSIEWLRKQMVSLCELYIMHEKETTRLCIPKRVM